jgi:hypothetical protein
MQVELELKKIRPGSIRWDPLQNITTQELALALPVVILLLAKPHFTEHDQAARCLEQLPETAKRHFSYRWGKP